MRNLPQEPEPLPRSVMELCKPGLAVLRRRPHLGVPTHSSFLYPRATRLSSRKWELRWVNRNWALLFLLSSGRSSWLGRASWAALSGQRRWEACSCSSPGSCRSSQSWQKLLCSSGMERNLRNLGDKQRGSRVVRRRSSQRAGPGPGLAGPGPG